MIFSPIRFGAFIQSTLDFYTLDQIFKYLISLYGTEWIILILPINFKPELLLLIHAP